MDKSNWLCTRMIVMSLDVSKDHVLKKITNNLNWSSEDTNVFCARARTHTHTYIYCGVLVLSIQILQQSQAYILYLRERTILPNCLKMLTPHQGSGECFFIKDYDFIHTRNLRYSNFKRRLFQITQYEDISRAANLEKSMEINHIFLHSHHQDFEYLL